MRVSAFPRWNSAVVETRKNAIDYVALDDFRQELLSQEEVYENWVRPFVKRCLQGFSGSIITYGARGSGKSYTLGTLDPQQLDVDTPCSDAAGVLPRCTRQLFECLGQGTCVEITCLELQGDEVVDLLDHRAGDTALGGIAAANVPAGGGSGACGSSGGGGANHGGASAARGAFARSPIAVTVAGAASGPRRKPLNLVVARSPTEALAALKRAVSNRQAFVTATRHSSSRTHAVFQLRWRNPVGPVAVGGGEAAAAEREAPRVSGGGAAQRAYSAPPRASLPTGPTGCPALAAAGGRPPPGWGAGPVCTLTLVDTCSFCPLLPPKEGSAVKRSMLALSRVLSALQRRHALSLRESKLTRMLEGAVDQVLVLACLGGSGDESTVQLVKMLQQGASRDSALRRSRRASSSDSSRVSGAWDADGAPHTGHYSVSAARLAGGAPRAPGMPPRGSSVAAANCSLGGKAAGPVLGPGPGRSIFRSPASPPAPAYGSRPVVSLRTECPGQGPGRAGVAGMDGGQVSCGSRQASSGGGTGTDTDAAAVRPLSSSSLDVSSPSSSPTGSSRSADGSGGEVAAVKPAAAPLSSRPAALTIDVCNHSMDGLVSPGGGDAGGRQAHSSNLSPSGPATVVPPARRLSPRLVFSPRQKPPSVAARAAPGPDVRRSQGFSVLAGKWAPPPPVSPRDKSFPVLPLLTPRSQRSSLAPPAAAASTDSNGSLAVSERPPLAGSGAKPGPRAASAPSAWGAGLVPPVGERNHGRSHDTAATPPCTGSGVTAATGSNGFVSPFTAASREPMRRTGVTASSTSDPPEQTGASPSGSLALAGSTPTRKKSGIPTRPPARSPQQSPFAAAAGASPLPRSTQRPVPRSPSPVGAAAAVVSLAAVRPTRLASMRYGSANISHDSAPDAAAVATSAVSISALLAAAEAVALPPNASPVSLTRMSSHRARQSVTAAAVGSSLGGGGGAAGAPVGVVSREVSGTSGAAALKRSISSGMRWPSPLLRARRAEWLTDMRRSRSALSRPVSEMRDEVEAGGATPRRRRGGFRCAALGRPTLSAQYKDLLLDFEAFKATERVPRQRRSALGAAAAPVLSAASAPPPSLTSAPRGPVANLSPERRVAVDGAVGAASSPVASEVLGPGSARITGAMPLPVRNGTALSSAPSPRQQGNVATAVAVAASPAASAGPPAASSPASISTPHSARPVSGSFARPVAAFSRAHSPSADDGLLSLTAAAAVAAASPRTPASGGALPSGRPRPGVSRAAGTMASPRPLRSPENTVTTVSPVMVLDMSRLFAAKGSPTPGATGTPPPLSDRSRLSAGSVNAAALRAAAALTSGGSERYRRLGEEDDPDSDKISEVAAADANPDADPDAVHGHSEAGSYPSGGSDSDQDNLLGPGCLGHLGLMLDTGGDVAALRNSISRLGDSCRASPAVAGAASTTATPSPLRHCAAAAALAAAAPCPCPSEGCSDGPDEELPAVSFFIHQFTPRPEFREGAAAADGQGPTSSAAAAGDETSCASAGAVAALPAVTSDAASLGGPVLCPRGDGDAPQLNRQEATETGVDCTTGVPPLQLHGEQVNPEPEQRLQRLRSPRHQAGAGISVGAVAVAAAAAVAELHLPYTSQDRASVESGVLRGSCTPFAVDAEGPAATSSAGGHVPLALPPPLPPTTAAALPDAAGGPEREPEPKTAAQQLGFRGQVVGSTGDALEPPSESSISLRQLLEQQEQLLLLQQRSGRRAATLAAVPPAPQMGEGQSRGQAGPGGMPAATLTLAQLAHVRPNHFDLDEQSNVLVDVDSASESDLAAGAARRVPAVPPQRSNRPFGGAVVAAVAVAVASPSRPPSAPLPEPPSAIRTPSPMKPSQSPSQLLSKASSVRARIAALGATMSPLAGSPATGHTGSPRTPPRVMQSWAHGGTGIHRSPAAAALAAAAAAAAATSPKGGSADSARRGMAQARSSPSPSAVAVVKAMAGAGRKAVSGTGAGHTRHTSDGAIGVGAAGSPALWRGSLGSKVAAVAGVLESPPRSPLPPPRLQIARSIDSDGAPHRPSPALSSPRPPPPPVPPSQQQHQQPLALPQQPQQPLRGSGNVAAAWRAAAAMTTSSSSSVRSCFRSSSGQQQHQQHNLFGSDAAAVATVVALSRASPPCCDDKQKAALALASGQATTAAATTAVTAVRLSGGVERLQSTRSSGNSTAAVAGSGVTAPAAALAIVPPLPLPPNPPVAPNPFATRSTTAGPAPPPCVPPLVLPPQQPIPVLAKAKSARGDRPLPLTARLRACASYRTPRAAASAAPANGGVAAAPALAGVAEQPPPPAYPPGFVTWATKLFAGSKKKKKQS